MIMFHVNLQGVPRTYEFTIQIDHEHVGEYTKLVPWIRNGREINTTKKKHMGNSEMDLKSGMILSRFTCVGHVWKSVLFGQTKLWGKS